MSTPLTPHAIAPSAPPPSDWLDEVLTQAAQQEVGQTQLDGPAFTSRITAQINAQVLVPHQPSTQGHWGWQQWPTAVMIGFETLAMLAFLWLLPRALAAWLALMLDAMPFEAHMATPLLAALACLAMLIYGALELSQVRLSPWRWGSFGRSV